jgi:hypothetical protein
LTEIKVSIWAKFIEDYALQWSRQQFAIANTVSSIAARSAAKGESLVIEVG